MLFIEIDSKNEIIRPRGEPKTREKASEELTAEIEMVFMLYNR